MCLRRFNLINKIGMIVVEYRRGNNPTSRHDLNILKQGTQTLLIRAAPTESDRSSGRTHNFPNQNFR